MAVCLHAFLESVAKGDRIPVSTDARFDGDCLTDLLSRLSTLAEVSVFIYLFLAAASYVRLNCL